MTSPLSVRLSGAHTNPNSLYMGFAFFLSELESDLSRRGSYVSLMHLIEREGSRAGMRSTTAVSWTDALGIGKSLSVPSARRGVVDCALVGAAVER